MRRKAIFIAATGQNVGKTTLCLGLIAGLRKRYSSVGFIKPVGQQQVKIDGKISVDKDVLLFKKYFSLPEPWNEMSPILIPPGFTRDFLDRKISEHSMLDKIVSSFQKIASENDYTIVEGTGHIGVGSIVNLNNARVAKKLDIDIILIASGGLGSAHDELALNLALCQQHHVRVRGVILNRVLEDKREMILDYFPKALRNWKIPLIGCVPYNTLLSQPSMQDFANLFETRLLSGEKYCYRHFQNIRFVADSVESYSSSAIANELIITSASREEIVLANIEKHKQESKHSQGFCGGIILTGIQTPRKPLVEKLKHLEIPTLYAPICSFDAMKMITSFTSKIRTEDTLKVEKAINIVENNIDFDALCQPVEFITQI